MKKILCLLATLLISVRMLIAVPAGTYCDDRGKEKVFIQGNTIYCLDNEGKVRSTWQIVKEDSDGRLHIKSVVNGQPVGTANSNNAWWSKDGKIYLNLANQARTLVRK